MKKQRNANTKRLVLDKQTIAQLSTEELGQAAGGDPYSKLSVCELNLCTRNN